MILLKGGKEIGVADGRGLLRIDEDDYDYYNFEYLDYYFEDLTPNTVRLKLTYWERSELVKLDFNF